MSIDFPQKDMKRAERRKKKALRYKQAKEVALTLFPVFADDEWQKEREEWARKHADNLKGCSCWMCCNPRRLNKETLQEKKFKESIKCE